MTQNNFLIIGITGITGSGTSTVAKILETHGGFVITADKLAHEVMGKGENAYAEIVKFFGKGILDDENNNEINRRALGTLVFGTENKAKLERLEQIIHPHVIAKIMTHIEEAKASGKYNFAVIDAPLLIESGLNAICTITCLVTASEPTRITRIINRDNIDEITAKHRLQSRKGDEFLRPHADVVIENNSDLTTLRQSISKELL
ncbi:MAG: dephospho-CoA kinase [Defluviitaleaceae bacterium]|nr:dephospho-CoA kinase [Defluviitaleaceae bacterium]